MGIFDLLLSEEEKWSTAWLGGLVLTLVVVGIAIEAVHNLYFGPLSSFPGPRLCAVSRLPQFLVTISGKQLAWLIDLHNAHGGVVRIAPDTLSFTDERAWNDICGSTKYAKDGMSKDPKLAAILGGDLLSPDPSRPRREQPHDIMRRALASAQKQQNVRQLEGMIISHIEEWLSVLKDSESKVDGVNVCESASFFICNLFGDMVLGESLNLFNDPKYRTWVHSFDRFAKGVTLLTLLNRFPFVHRPLLYAVRRWGNGERHSFLDPVYEQFDRRMKAQTLRNDMVRIMLEDDDDAPNSESGRRRGMPAGMLREFTPFLMLGACDPIPGIIAALTYYVFRPQGKAIKDRLLREVRNKFASEEEINIDRVRMSSKELPYLEACLMEVFRCYAPGIGTDRVCPVEGSSIAGKYVPGETIVILQHQPSYLLNEHFSRPTDYIPERWLSSENGRPAEFDNDRRSIVHPFSVGPSSCPGQEISFYIIRLSLCKYLYRYDVQLTPASENWLKGQVTFTVRMRPPLMVKMRSPQHLNIQFEQNRLD